MDRINWTRVVLGGLFAGLIINFSEFLLNMYVIGEEFAAAMEALGVSDEMSSSTMIVWIVYCFVLGVASVWLYAAIRPRYGPGMKTATCAGLAVWFFTALLPSVGFINIGLFPPELMLTSLVWALVELWIAAVAGAWLYREETAAIG